MDDSDRYLMRYGRETVRCPHIQSHLSTEAVFIRAGMTTERFASGPPYGVPRVRIPAECPILG